MLRTAGDDRGRVPQRFRFLSGACVSAEAATLLTFAGVFGLLSSFDAFDATDLDVCSGFLAILGSINTRNFIENFGPEFSTKTPGLRFAKCELFVWV